MAITPAVAVAEDAGVGETKQPVIKDTPVVVKKVVDTSKPVSEAVITADAQTEQAEKYPPPPTPEFLKPELAKEPLPRDQMELIKQTFAPEYYLKE